MEVEEAPDPTFGTPSQAKKPKQSVVHLPQELEGDETNTYGKARYLRSE